MNRTEFEAVIDRINEEPDPIEQAAIVRDELEAVRRDNVYSHMLINIVSENINDRSD